MVLDFKIFCHLIPFMPIVPKNALVILVLTLSPVYDGEMVIMTNLTTLLQLFCGCLINTKNCFQKCYRFRIQMTSGSYSFYYIFLVLIQHVKV